MSVLTAPSLPAPATPPPVSFPYQPFGGLGFIRRISVAEYHRMIQTGILTEGEPVELLEGYLVLKMPRSPQHDFALGMLNKRLLRMLPDGWEPRSQSAATLAESEPETDYAIVRGAERDFAHRHPSPADTALFIEVSNSSLTRDRTDKARIYARAGIPVYWVVNLVDRVIEVFTRPSGPADAPAYAQRDEYKPGDAVPVVLDGVEVGRIAVSDVIA